MGVGALGGLRLRYDPYRSGEVGRIAAGCAQAFGTASPRFYDDNLMTFLTNNEETSRWALFGGIPCRIQEKGIAYVG